MGGQTEGLYNRRPFAGTEQLILLAFFTALCMGALAQTPPAYVPNIIPPSPNAATLMKYTDIPVGTYTGAADVSVPIYNIEAKGLSIPVTLGYHTGGIRLKDEAGWVGLGWALNAGGSISRTVMDKDDFNGTDYFNSTVPQMTGDPVTPTYNYGNLSGTNYAYAFFCNDMVYTSTGNLNYWPILNPSNSPYWDLESDIYSYSFPGHSGKFVITRDKRVLLQKQENIKVAFDSTGKWFNITDDQGNQFYFANRELTQPGTGGASVTSTWNLSQVTTQQKDVVNFNYVTDSTWTQVQSDISQTQRYGCLVQGLTSVQSNGTLYLNTTLTSIDFTSGQLQFSFTGGRTDLQNGKQLNGIKIYSKNASGSLVYVKEQQLFYSYFNSGQAYGTNYEFERLRLDSIREANTATGSLVPPYIFSYNTSPYAGYEAKHGYSIDHWGFDNGADNSSFIPSWQGMVNPTGTSSYYTYTGANREPDSANMKAFSLVQVQYPTGGSTVFSYEPNYYDKSKSTNGPVDLPQIATQDSTYELTITARNTTTGTLDMSSVYPSSVYGNATIAVTFRTNTGDVNSSHYTGSNGKIYLTFNGNTYDISDAGLTYSGGNTVATENITLTAPATSISWTAHIDSTEAGTDFNGITFYVVWRKLSPTTGPLMAGGLRVHSVTDYAASGTIAKQRVYNYNYVQNGGTFSYGRLMSFPIYARYESFVDTYTGTSTNPEAVITCEGLTLFGSSYTPTTSVAGGNIVGYDHVEVRTVNPQAGNDIGMEVDSFFNSSDTSYSYADHRLPGTMNMGNNLNGSLLQKRVYANNGGTYQEVSETDNYYHTANRMPLYSPKYTVGTQSGGGSNNTCPGDSCVTYQYLFCLYPSVKSERVLLDSTREVVFDQATPSLSFSTLKTFSYDNPLHYQTTRTHVYDSKGSLLVSHVKYPQDYIPTGQTKTSNTVLDTMINKNMVAATVEKSDSLYTAGSSSGSVTGSLLSLFKIVSSSGNNVALPDKTYKLMVAAPVTDFQPMAISGNTVTQDSRYALVASMDSYDSAYNIAQYTPTDEVPVSIIWDYKHTYPVAKVTHATVAQAAYTSFEADGWGGWSVPSAVRDTLNAITGSRSYNLTNGSVTKTGLTSTTTYIVSYWSKSGSSYTVAGSTGYKQGKTINGFTYFEHTVTGITTETVSGSNDIDELRLYPSIAQMVTYTYTPLVGMTAQCDVNNRVTYYEYDGLGRLVVVRDQDRNVVKRICYNYYGQPGACNEAFFFNVVKSGTYTRNNCTGDSVGTSVTYTVPAGTYYANTQAAADSLAQNNVNTNGQAYANANGSCTATAPANVTITAYGSTSIKGFTIQFYNIGTGTTYNYTYPNAGTATLCTIPQGAYNITFTNSSNTTTYYFYVGSTGTTGTTSATFSNILINTSTYSVTITTSGES